MNRTLWFVAGAGFGVYTLTKARRAAEAFTPEGLRDRMAGLSLGAHLFSQEVKTEMSNRLELSGRVSPMGELHPDKSAEGRGN